MIPKIQFGRTLHQSSRIIFGGYALSNASQEEADDILKLLFKYGVNHIDTARIYGKAEERIGPWMEKHRNDFFLATKTRSRQYEKAWKEIETSLQMLRVKSIDLLQIHALTNPQGWETAMSSDGALQALIEARDQGLVKFLGVTGHGGKAAKMHMQSLERFEFDSVLLGYNYLQMKYKKYAENFKELVKICNDQNIAVLTIKSVAGRPWEGQPRTYNTYFYEPLVEQEAIDKAVHWALGLEDCFVITAGDMKILPKVLNAAERFETRPTDSEMESLVEKQKMKHIFTY